MMVLLRPTRSGRRTHRPVAGVAGRAPTLESLSMVPIRCGGRCDVAAGSRSMSASKASMPLIWTSACALRVVLAAFSPKIGSGIRGWAPTLAACAKRWPQPGPVTARSPRHSTGERPGTAIPRRRPLYACHPRPV